MNRSHHFLLSVLACLPAALVLTGGCTPFDASEVLRSGALIVTPVEGEPEGDPACSHFVVGDGLSCADAVAQKTAAAMACTELGLEPSIVSVSTEGCADGETLQHKVDCCPGPVPADEPPADEPPADEPPADEPPADEPPAENDPPLPGDEPPLPGPEESGGDPACTQFVIGEGLDCVDAITQKGEAVGKCQDLGLDPNIVSVDEGNCSMGQTLHHTVECCPAPPADTLPCWGYLYPTHDLTCQDVDSFEADALAICADAEMAMKPDTITPVVGDCLGDTALQVSFLCCLTK